uniref:Plastid lipid-associated protein/fibrillin conserved domain-containing protein n=1 Tax=Leptocylindrus danicus TaxID=163516 RepID=A0A7S2PC84_9STRA
MFTAHSSSAFQPTHTPHYTMLMKKAALSLLLLVSSLTEGSAFVSCNASCKGKKAFFASSGLRSSIGESGLEGNRRAPTPNEIAIMDEMITKLANAQPTELPNAVSKAIRIVSSPQFFMRIAQRSDMEQDEEQKEKLSVLANNIARTLEVVVSTTENRLDERSKEVEQVVKAAAEPDTGEFLWPLTPERCEAIQAEMRKLDPGALDESFLLTIDAWMNKSMQDGMDGMVGILQKVLQAYAGTAVSRARDALATQVGAAVTGTSEQEAEAIVSEAQASKEPSSGAIVLEKLLAMDTETWDSEIRNAVSSEEVKLTDLKSELQGTMEGVVLGLENGSMTQQVQAEYLRELMTRIEAASD